MNLPQGAKSAIGTKETHYGFLDVFLGRKKIFHYGYETTSEPLNPLELQARAILSDVKNGDDDTFDACFKAVLKYINKG